MKNSIKRSSKLLITLLLLLTMPSLTRASVTDIGTILKRIERESGCKLHITSRKRSKKHNKRVGGAKNSFHLSGRAIDFRSAYRKRGCGIKRLARISCKYATTIRYKWHVHIDNRKVKRCFNGSYKKRK